MPESIEIQHTEPDAAHIVTTQTVRQARMRGVGYQQYAVAPANADLREVYRVAQEVDFVLKNLPPAIWYLRLQVEAGRIRYRDDGGQCDASTGMLYTAGTEFTITLRAPSGVHILLLDATSIINVSYYGAR